MGKIKIIKSEKTRNQKEFDKIYKCEHCESMGKPFLCYSETNTHIDMKGKPFTDINKIATPDKYEPTNINKVVWLCDNLKCPFLEKEGEMKFIRFGVFEQIMNQCSNCKMLNKWKCVCGNPELKKELEAEKSAPSPVSSSQFLEPLVPMTTPIHSPIHSDEDEELKKKVEEKGLTNAIKEITREVLEANDDPNKEEKKTLKKKSKKEQKKEVKVKDKCYALVRCSKYTGECDEVETINPIGAYQYSSIKCKHCNGHIRHGRRPTTTDMIEQIKKLITHIISVDKPEETEKSMLDKMSADAIKKRSLTPSQQSALFKMILKYNHLNISK